MLFHLGGLWRLNELGYLRKFELLSAVSAGAILAAQLATSWKKLKFDNLGVARNFDEAVVQPIRKLAEETIDISSAIRNLLPFGNESGAHPLASKLSSRLYGSATLQEWPVKPRFIVSATNVQFGSLFRFSRAYLADARLGRIASPKIDVATAVAASAAVPPVLSPMVLKFKPTAWLDAMPVADPRFQTAVHLTDGSVYDHYGIEPAWKRYRTILISDAAARRNDEPEPSQSWPAQISRVLDLVTLSGRAQRRQQIIEAFASRQRSGAFWSISSKLENYGDSDSRGPKIDIEGLDVIPTRYATLDPGTQMRLINWGYTICGVAMRTHMGAGELPSNVPYPIGS
jgi:NTE family protein